MTYELLCQNSKTSVVYNITALAGNIQHQTQLGGQPGKLTFSVQQDTNNVLEMVCGSIILFSIDGVGIFKGYIFTMGTDATGVYKITAYDQMRYLKNEEVYTTSEMTASQIFELVCRDVYPGLRVSITGDTYRPPELPYQIVTPTTFVVPEYFHNRKTLYSIIEYGIDRTNIEEGNKPVAERHYYYIKDKFGVLQFTELGQGLTNLIIGERSLLTSYQYEISVDKNTYNSVVIVRDNETTGKRDVWSLFDSETQKQWGKLQMVQEADKNANEAQIRELAFNLMELRNRETKTMKLTALGRPELVAGSGFNFQLDKLGLKQNMWITSATHNYERDYHTMELAVFI